MPAAIIGIVLLAVIGGGAWLYSSSKPPTGNTNVSTPSTNRPAANQANAPVGATPPNMLGSPTAAVTVEEFADFQCGSCAATHPALKEIQSIYGSKIKFVFRHYPLAIPAHDKAYDAAAAAEAAGMQGKFWAMQDQLFANQQTWTQNPNYRQLWVEYATKVGLDVQRFQADAAGIAAKSRVDQDMSRGRALNVNSTPTIFINGFAVPLREMNVDGMRRIVDAELQKAPASQSQAPAGQSQTPATAPASPAAANAAVKPANNSNSR